MAWEEDAEEPEFRPPLPPEDRLWRHPSEWNAEQLETSGTSPAPDPVDLAAITVLHDEPQASHSWRSRTLVIASLSALGAAMLVSGLFITLDSTDASPALGEPPIETIARNPVVPRTIQVDAADWAHVVSQDTAPAIASVRVVAGERNRLGSAVVIRGDGYLLTSHDLVAGGTSISVQMPGAELVAAHVVGLDYVSGIAVLGIDGADLPTAPLGFFVPAPEIGAPVVTLAGNTSTTDLQMGVVTGTRTRYPVAEDRNLHGLLASSQPMPVGGSGGAMVDKNGAVVGIVVDLGALNSSYAVPIAYARQVAEDIMNYSEARHSWVAIRGIDLPLDEARDLDVAGGVEITEILAAGPAEAAGLRAGDIVVQVDDQPIWAMSDLVLELRRHAPGHLVDLTFLRDGLPRTVTVNLGLRPNE